MYTSIVFFPTVIFKKYVKCVLQIYENHRCKHTVKDHLSTFRPPGTKQYSATVLHAFASPFGQYGRAIEGNNAQRGISRTKIGMGAQRGHRTSFV